MQIKYWNGALVIIVTDQLPGMDAMSLCQIYRVYDDERCKHPQGAEIAIPRENLQDVVDNVYKLGATVRSKIGELKGTVVGYEFESNKVVVKSSKIKNYDNHRTRYVYSLDEIEYYDADALSIVPGKYYKINNQLDVIAVKSVHRDDEVMLFDRAGSIRYHDVDKDTTYSSLRALHNIYKIKPLNKNL